MNDFKINPNASVWVAPEDESIDEINDRVYSLSKSELATRLAEIESQASILARGLACNFYRHKKVPAKEDPQHRARQEKSWKLQHEIVGIKSRLKNI